jgi:hypothetical protein
VGFCTGIEIATPAGNAALLPDLFDGLVWANQNGPQMCEEKKYR